MYHVLLGGRLLGGRDTSVPTSVRTNLLNGIIGPYNDVPQMNLLHHTIKPV